MPGASLLQRLLAQTRRNAAPAWATGSQVVTSAGNFLTSVIIIHAAGLAEFGRFSVAFIILMITRNYLNALVLVPMSTIGPKLLATSADTYRGFLLANASGFCLLTSALLYLLASVIGRLIGSPWLADIALAMACANAISNFADFMRRYLLIGSRPGRGFALDCLRYLVQLPLLLAAGDVFGTLDARTALAILAIGSLVAAAYGLIHYGAMRWRPLFARSVWPRHWNFIKWMAPGATLETVQANAALLTGAILLTDAELGTVRVVLQMSNVLNIPANALQQVLPSMATIRLIQDGRAGLVKLLAQATSAVVVAMAAVTVAIALPWQSVVRFVLGTGGEGALLMFIIYQFAFVILAFRLGLQVYFQTIERPRSSAAVAMVGAAIAAVASAPLIGIWGPVGIPVSALMVAAATTLLFAWAACRSLLGKSAESAHG